MQFVPPKQPTPTNVTNVSGGGFGGPESPNETRVQEGPNGAPRNEFDEILTPTVEFRSLLSGPPLVPVDWAWQCALYLTPQFPELAEEWNTPAIRSARSFQSQLRRCQTQVDHLRLAKRHKHQYEALRLRVCQNPLRAAEVQAWILAGQNHDEIGQRVGLSPRTINWYERWFFDVRDRPPSYINNQVLQIHTLQERWDIATIWKFWGYRGGPVVLEAVMREFSPELASTPRQQTAELRPHEVIDRLWVRVMVLNHMMPIKSKTALRIFRFYFDFQRWQAKSKAPSLIGAFSENVRAMLEGFPQMAEVGESGEPEPHAAQPQGV